MILRKNIYKIMSVFLCISALSGCTDKNMDLYKNDKEVKKTVDDSRNFYNTYDFTQVLRSNDDVVFSDGLLTYRLSGLKYKDGFVSIDVSVIADKYNLTDVAFPVLNYSYKGKLIPFEMGVQRNLFSIRKGEYFVLTYKAKAPKSGVLKIDTNSGSFKFNYMI